jgi:hypothetical protein
MLPRQHDRGVVDLVSALDVTSAPTCVPGKPASLQRESGPSSPVVALDPALG